MADTPTVKLHSDGSIECAKGLELTECGYKVGDKVCGKCGAGTISVKTDEVEVADEVADDGEWVTVGDTKGMGKTPMQNLASGAGKTPMQELAYDNELQEPGIDAELTAARKKARKKRMDTMGVKSEEFEDDAFVCAFERKVLPASAQVCASCPGGCASEQGMPSLLEVEGFAEDMFSGKVLDSGYSDETDIFVVDVQRKDGKPIEAFFDGSTGECMGWHLLNQEVIGEVAEISGTKVISFSEAAELAVKSIEGDVVSVDADMFEGYDAFAVEVEGLDGKSYDVFVSLDGEVLGWDEYEAEEAADIDAEVADLALKRMYSEESRTTMADEGEAMPDGSFPIKNRADLQNAVSAYGRAKDKEAAKAHIMKRAEALDAVDMIPASWKEVADTTAAADMKAKNDEDASRLLVDLMEFEMLAIEHGIED